MARVDRESVDDWDFREYPDQRNAFEFVCRAPAVKKPEKKKTMAKKQRMKSELVKFVTPEFRASFPALFEARAAKEGDKPKYSVQMLFQVTDTEKSKAAGTKALGEKGLDGLKKLIRDVVEEKFGADRTKWPPLGDRVGELQLPLHDGNSIAKKDKDGYGPGIIYATASSDPRWNPRPGIVYPHADPATGRPATLTVPSDVYGGCYMRATINAYFWEYMGKMGVSLGLQHVQKLRDGETFSGRGKAENDFDCADVPAGATAAGPVGAAPSGSGIGV